jgi:hypothetical protein
VTCGGQQQFFSVCPADGGAWTRNYNGLNYDFEMYLRSAQTGAEVACDDDAPSQGLATCPGNSYGTGSADSANYGSRLNNIVTPRGIGLQFDDERDQAASTASAPNEHYQMVYTIR